VRPVAVSHGVSVSARSAGPAVPRCRRVTPAVTDRDDGADFTRPPPPIVGKVTHYSVELYWDEALKQAHSEAVKGEGPVRITVQEQDQDQRTWGNVYTGVGKRCEVRGLEEKTEYRFRMRFQQAESTSEWSPMTAVSTTREPLNGQNLHRTIIQESLADPRASVTERRGISGRAGFPWFYRADAGRKEGLFTVSEWTWGMEMLLEHGAEVDYKNESGKTALMMVCAAGKLEPVKVLRKHGARYDLFDNGGCAPIHWAVDGNNVKLIEWMAEDGADLNLTDKGHGRWTPLIRCANLHGNRDLALALMMCGADIHSTDCSGSTALHHAVMRKHFELTQLLLQRRADPLLQNKEDHSAYLIAMSSDDRRRIAALMEPYVEKAKNQQKSERRARDLQNAAGQSETPMVIVPWQFIGIMETTSTVEGQEGTGNGTEVQRSTPVAGAACSQDQKVSQLADNKLLAKKPGVAAIKPEFLVHDYTPQLANEYVSAESKEKLKQKTEDSADFSAGSGVKRKHDETEGDDAAGGDTSEKKSKRKLLKGRNKQRPVFKTKDADKACPAILQEQECKFGDKCKFSHDVAAFLQNKPKDLGEECHNFKTFGRCPYGFACRFATHHLSSEHKNLTNQELFDKMAAQPQVRNTLTKDLQHLLWKKKYDFSRAFQVVDDYYSQIRGEDGQSGKGDSRDHRKYGISSDSTQKEVDPITDEGEIRLHPREKKLVDFSNKLYLAPLTTVGNLPFRRLCKKYGADITCGEMAMASNLLQGQQSEWALLKRHHTEDIFGVQICGAFPDMMTRCGQLLQEQTEIDFIDINSGCPIDLIYKRGEGCALMGKITKYENIVRCMNSVIDVPLTVKMRTGIMDGKNTAHTLIPRLRDAGAALVTLHGRSREQRYTRLADWDYIKQCAEVASPMPVFGNGDILSFEDYNLHKEASGVSGIMIARGALIKPWIFTEIKEQRHWDISANERFDMLRDYCNFGLEYWGSDTKGVENTRRFLLEWLSFLYRYIPVGVLERPPQKINERPPHYHGRNDLETLMASPSCGDWVKISEMLLGPVPEQFTFLPKHKANAYQ
ncbi:hypothetical protein BaRGS_00025530, partial [Batillaria attramentaria]